MPECRSAHVRRATHTLMTKHNDEPISGMLSHTQFNACDTALTIILLEKEKEKKKKRYNSIMFCNDCTDLS